MLFKSAMRAYQKAGNSDKIMEVGRKGLAIDGDDPELLVTVSSELAEKTRDTDLDKDQRLDEAMKMAQKSLQTVDTDISDSAEHAAGASRRLQGTAAFVCVLDHRYAGVQEG